MPKDYDEGVSDYPVLYVMDGENTFNTISGLIDLNIWLYTIPSMIVVGIPNVDRMHDFMPKNDTIPTSGNADNFISFFNEELFPFMNDNYRTNSFKMIFGFSYTGMFAIHCFKNYPETFNAYIAGSPALYHNIEQLCEGEILINNESINRFLHISIGAMESEEYKDNINRFAEYVENQKMDMLKLKNYKVDGATHETNLPFSINYGLDYIFSDYLKLKEVIYKGIDSIESHFESLSKHYSYEVKTPEPIYQMLGQYLLSNEDVEGSLKVFEIYTKTYELSYIAFDMLGQAYIAKKDNKKAEECFLNALILKPDYQSSIDNLNIIKSK